MTQYAASHAFRRLLGAGVALALLGSGCTVGSEVTSDPTSTTTVETTTSSETTEAPPESTTTTEGPAGPTTPDSMPGDVIDFGPARGDQIAVVGVEHDDRLNVRIAPGVEFDVIDELDPDADDLLAQGENRLLESSFWIEIASGDGNGWVNEAFTGFLGVAQDLESDVTVETSDPVDVGMVIAQGYASEDPPSRITLARVDGDTIVYDVLGLGDDAVKGFRLTVVTEAAGDGRLGVSSINEQTICSRGLAPDLRCV